MPFELKEVLRARQGENFRLHAQYMNPQLARVLKTIGFDRFYDRGEGCYLYDAEGERYLDFLSGFGVFALGRSHPAVKRGAARRARRRPAQPGPDGLRAAARAAGRGSWWRRSHPGIERVFFSNSGAEAVESAIKFARAATEARPDRLLRPRASTG